MAENREYITCQMEQGTVNISEDVLCAIAAVAVSELDGVAGFASSFGKDLADFLGKKGSSKGLKITIDGDNLQVDVFVLLKYGVVINDEARALQQAVSSEIEAMTGIKVTTVNVHVCGIAFAKGSK